MQISASTPPHARLVIEAANSYDVEDASDAWATPAQLARWLDEHTGLKGRIPASAVTAEDHEAAVRVRDRLRIVILERRDPTFGTAARQFPLHVGFDEGAPTLVPVGSGVAGGVARILAAVAQSSFDGSWERIKICPADDCRVAFYDESRNRSRAWCSMEVCGNRTKTRVYRARHR